MVTGIVVAAVGPFKKTLDKWWNMQRTETLSLMMCGCKHAVNNQKINQMQEQVE